VASDSFAARILELGEELRAEGMKVGTTGLLDAFDALEHVDWTDHDIFKEALATTLAKSPDDRRVFDLVFDRFFFRAAEAAAVQEGVREQDASPAGGGDLSGDQALDALRQQIAAAMRDGNESAMRDLARLAIAAFGRQGEGSGSSASTCSASAVRWACAPSRSPTCRPTTRAATGSRATSCAASRRCCAASSSAGRSSARRPCRPSARSTSSTARCRRDRCRTSLPCTASSPSSSAG
jgi:uncharacterized protein with von Willebrand factor type A (vWA) domain